MIATDASSGKNWTDALPFRFEHSVVVNASPEAAFSRLDDSRFLSAQMSRTS